MIVSIDAEKIFDKIKHEFMIKTFNKVSAERMNLSIIKAIYHRPIAMSEILPLVVIGMDIKDTMLSEISQKHKYCMFPFIYGIQK